MWDFNDWQPISQSLMEYQCALGLQWLPGRTDQRHDLLGHNLCDLNIDAVNWTRDWIAQVGDQPLTTPKPRRLSSWVLGW